MDQQHDAQAAAIEDVAAALRVVLPHLPSLPRLRRIEVVGPPYRPAMGIEVEFERTEFFTIEQQARLERVFEALRGKAVEIYHDLKLEIEWLRPPLHVYAGFVAHLPANSETIYPRFVRLGRVRLRRVKRRIPA